MYPKKRASVFSRKYLLWLQVIILVAAFLGVLKLIAYLQSGRLEQSPGVQAFINPEVQEVGISARVVVDKAEQKARQKKDPDSAPKDH